MKVKLLSHVQLFATQWTVAREAPLSTGSSRQEYWNGLPFPSPEDLLDLGLEPESSALAGEFFTTEPPGSPRSLLLKSLSLCYNLTSIGGIHLSTVAGTSVF